MGSRWRVLKQFRRARSPYRVNGEATIRPAPTRGGEIESTRLIVDATAQAV